MQTLIDFVRQNVSPKAYFESVFGEDIRYPSPPSEPRVACVFHQEKEPSLHFNPETGGWFCHGCGAGGKSIISFEAKLGDMSKRNAAISLFHKFIHPVVSEKTIRRWRRALMDTPTALSYLKRQRHFTDETITNYQLGWTGTRWTIPIRNEFGICVNVKMHEPISKKHKTPKMVSYKLDGESRSYGSPPMLYPLDCVTVDEIEEGDFIFVTAGEPDALVLRSMGLIAVTTTSGEKSWPRQYNELFRGKTVVIVRDNDTEGKAFVKRVTQRLGKFALVIKSINVVNFPGKDVTDWYGNDNRFTRPRFWKNLAEKSPVVLDNPVEKIELSKTVDVSLQLASKSEYYNRRMRVKATVAGKENAPYLLPKEYRITCNRTCETCPLLESIREHKDCKLDSTSPDILGLIDAEDTKVRSKLLAFAGFDNKPTCKAKIEYLHTFNVEKAMLIPSLEESQGQGGQYVISQAYYVGHGLNSNRSYEFEGTTIPSPDTQEAVNLFDLAKPSQSAIDRFSITPQRTDELRRAFHPGRVKPMAKLKAIADWQSRHVTKIYDRPDLHIAVDLTYHSVVSFEFNKEFQKRGMIDMLVIGDTRCGKGYVAEGLLKFYGLGEVASGENCSFAGLVGGLQQLGTKRYMVTWGMLPLNHGRLAVIDEASSLSPDDFAKLSRVRSEGIAEITKIVRESTWANLRLIWLSNTRSGRGITTGYSYGIEAVRDLIGANEDISRFDFVVTVAKEEVSAEVINSQNHLDMSDANEYSSDLFRDLVMWAWSRTPDQVKFTDEATELILIQAIALGTQFSSEIPLVQGENIRVKIAKIAVAVAARLFNTDGTGERLLVEDKHVQCAIEFLTTAYTKPSMGYDLYSQMMERKNAPIDKKVVNNLFNEMGDRREILINDLSIHAALSDKMAQQSAGGRDAADLFFGKLMSANCVVFEKGVYRKQSSFATWIKESSNGTLVSGRNGSSHRGK